MFIHERLLRRLKINKVRKLLLASAGIFFVFVAGSAQASLGGNVASVVSDQNALGTSGTAAVVSASSTAATNSTSASALLAGYTIQTVVQTGGTTIHEYIGTDGTVFAVSWAGPFMPNLRQLFGTYFSSYQNEAARLRANTNGHGPLSVDDGELVVQSTGGMHNFTGNAYLKSHVPGTFSVDLIR